MKAAISQDDGRQIFARLVGVMASADTWHGRAMEMRVIFDALLHKVAPEVKTEGAFWKEAIDCTHPDDSGDPADATWREELHEWRQWFNALQHENAGYGKHYRGYDRHTVMEVLRSMASYVNAISGCPIDPRITDACIGAGDFVCVKPCTVVILCELGSVTGEYAEGAKLVDALRDIPYKKQLLSMSSDVDIQSIVYTEPLIHFRDSSDNGAFEYRMPPAVDRALSRAVGTLKSRKDGWRWLVWRTSNPLAASPEAIRALNEAIADLGIKVVPMATTSEAEREFRKLWRGVIVYRVNNPMLPDNMINSILQTILRESVIDNG